MKPIAEIWALLKRDKPTDGKGWLVRGIAPDGPCTVLAAVRYPDSRPALLVEVASRTVRHDTQYPRSRGFELYPETVKPGPSGTVRLCLVLTDSYHEDLFAILAEDTVSSVASAANELDAIARFLQRLTVWQSFMQRYGHEGLSLEQTAGLYGELVCFETLLNQGQSPAILTEAWKGPLNGLRDYELSVSAVEVKTTLQQPPKDLRISSLEQLDERSTERLYLCHVSLLSAVAEGESLNELVDTLRTRLNESDRDAYRHFDDLLIQAGYVSGQAGPYADTPFVRDGFTLFQVSGDFPRLRSCDVHSGIEHCTYSIQLSALTSYRVPVEAIVAQPERGREHD